MSPNIKCLTPQEEERFLDILRNRKDAKRAYMFYHLMLITNLRLSKALSLNVEHANRAKVELKVKGWIKNKPEGNGLASFGQSHSQNQRERSSELVEGKKNRFKTACSERSRTIYFPKALQGHLKEYLKVKARREESLLPGAPLFPEITLGSVRARCKGILRSG